NSLSSPRTGAADPSQRDVCSQRTSAAIPFSWQTRDAGFRSRLNLRLSAVERPRRKNASDLGEAPMLKQLKRKLLGKGRRHHTVSDSSFMTRGMQHLWHRQWLRRRINYLLVIALVVGLAAFGVGVHFLHQYQVQRNASSLLEHARRVKSDEKFEQAA